MSPCSQDAKVESELLDQLPAVVAVTDPEGRITGWNPRAESVLGWSGDEVAGRSIFELVVPESGMGRADDVLAVLTSGDTWEGDLELLRKDRTSLPAHVAVAPIRGPDGSVTALVGVTQDVTARRDAEAAVEVSEELLRSVTQAVGDAVVSVNPRGRVVFWNAKAAEMFGYPLGEAIGMDAGELIPPRYRPAYRWGLERLCRGGAPELLPGGTIELHALRRDGAEVPVELSLGTSSNGSAVYTGVVRDVSERKRAAEQLHRVVEERRRLLHHLVRAQERERQLIAADVHDESLQAMVALGLRLEELLELAPDGELRRAVEQAHGTVDAAVARLRHLIFQLSPPSESRGDLGASIRILAAETGLDHRVEDRLDGSLDEETEVLLYRLAREALENVRKHARASTVHVALESRDGGVELSVRDDGTGFDPDEVTSMVPHRFGVAEMRERAEMAGGSCRIESGRGEGTCVAFWIPSAPPPPVELRAARAARRPPIATRRLR